MNRRDMMLATLGTLAASTLVSEEAIAQQSTAAAGPFSVRSGASRGDGPWLLGGRNPVTAKVTSADTSKRFSVIEVETPPGRGPEMHIHTAQNEFFLVLRGSIGILCGTDRTVLRAGDSFMAPLGVPHSYVTLSAEPARILNIFDPAGDMEAHFAALAKAIRPDGPPDPKEIEAAYAQHGMKLVGPPVRAAGFVV